MKKFIIKETKESFSSIHELRQHALIEQIKDYTLIVREDKKMTEGISKERLIDFDPWAYDNQQDLLNAILEQCTELNPWLPIDDDTPINRVIWLFSGGNKHLGIWEFGGVGDGLGYWADIPFGNKITPTHWQELPEDPKE